MARRSALRASDLDREHVAERLRTATAEGRLLASELEERLTSALTARTYGELDALVADLPVVRGRARLGLGVKLGMAAALAVAVMAVIALVTLVVVGLAGAWMAWLLAMWLMFGRRGRRGRFAGYSRSGCVAYGRRVDRTRSPRSGPAAL